MRLSWSKKLFIKINSHLGESPFIDSVAVFGAKWAIGILVISFFIYVYGDVGGDMIRFLSTLGVTLVVFVIALATSYLIALMWHHDRPEVELPQSRSLIHLLPFEMWKSFPSDHTLTAFFLALLVVANEGGLTGSALIFLLWASYIALSRVVVGVHYPRDIVGGVLLAFFYVYYFESIAGFVFRVFFV